MSSHFQNRLVGIIVLVALGVIFLPDILDGKKEHQVEQFSEIPLRPEVESASLPDEALVALDLSEKAKAFESSSVESDSAAPAIEPATGAVSADKRAEPQAESKVVAKTESKSIVKAEKKPTIKPSSAYTLQLGSFNNAANVRGLVKQLRGKGFNAYTLPVTPIDGKLTKVFVGPELSKSKLQSLQSGIEKLTKLKGRIVAYEPTAS
ncbi:sporulation domain protein [Shewanella sediminis HAW-EB3]|uniref:Sporulation domain protein n=1 Tax=Shewanella sediminis (strain HAW-EB3) TaxID=425104 RepID=A8FTU2_SHESH|nr:SPOR domain-containing protein [Shewanella sediminis]ABV36265.1 sporulation domain protein [Shewanella sediminis HAW-EB3]